MPLTEKVTYTTILQSGNKIQIPKLIRWRFKIEPNQALKIGVNFTDLHKGWEFFYTKMRNEGRITIPKLILCLFADEKTTLAGYVLEIIIEPA